MEAQRSALIASVRETLLVLHKALIDVQRAEHERAHGKRLSPGELLQLLTGDQAFDWLHPFSLLIVAIDELLERQEPPTERDAAAVRVEVERILSSASYTKWVEKDPNVALEHGRIGAGLARLPAAPPEQHHELLTLRETWRGPPKIRRRPSN